MSPLKAIKNSLKEYAVMVIWSLMENIKEQFVSIKAH